MAQDAGGSDAVLLAVDRLRASGVRVTPGRRAVVAAIAAAEGQLGADELAAAVQDRVPGLHLSTVYRSLDALQAAGVVVHTHLGHGRAVYRLAGDGPIHAECDTCGARLAVRPALLRPVVAALADEHDFALDLQHAPLLGRCRACRAAAGTAPHRHR